MRGNRAKFYHIIRVEFNHAQIIAIGVDGVDSSGHNGVRIGEEKFYEGPHRGQEQLSNRV